MALCLRVLVVLIVEDDDVVVSPWCVTLVECVDVLFFGLLLFDVLPLIAIRSKSMLHKGVIRNDLFICAMLVTSIAACFVSPFHNSIQTNGVICTVLACPSNTPPNPSPLPSLNYIPPTSIHPPPPDSSSPCHPILVHTLRQS